MPRRESRQSALKMKKDIKTEKALEQDNNTILETKLCCYVGVVF